MKSQTAKNLKKKKKEKTNHHVFKYNMFEKMRRIISEQTPLWNPFEYRWE